VGLGAVGLDVGLRTVGLGAVGLGVGVKCVYLHLGRECLSYPRFRRKCFSLKDYVCIEMCVLNSDSKIRISNFEFRT
jgi:hypothetical protein